MLESQTQWLAVLTAAYPTSEEDWGSDRQIKAENELYRCCKLSYLVFPNHETSKATVEERLDEVADALAKGGFIPPRFHLFFVLNGLQDGEEGVYAHTCGFGKQLKDGWYYLLADTEDGVGPFVSREQAKREAIKGLRS